MSRVRQARSASVRKKATLTFARGGDELIIERHRDREGVILRLILNDTAIRTYRCRDLSAALRWQARMERTFLSFDWSFVGHLPERRRLRSERRRLPRPTDRRRFWTSGYLAGLELF